MAARHTMPAKPRNPPPRKHRDPADPRRPPPARKLERAELERYLWASADILRGSIDSSDYKHYILGLLFLKRLSDRFQEECEILEAQSLDPNDETNHEIVVPNAATWTALQGVTSNIGAALNRACSALESRNPALEGVLAGINYDDAHRLGDARQRDAVLLRLVQHFSGLSLRNDHLSEPDILGRAYEYLIEQFADDAGKKGGEFYTPRRVAELIAELLAPEAGMSVCDPTCGSGGMLIECASFLQRRGGDPKTLRLYGQEKNLGTWAICRMNMLLHGLEGARIERGDTIRRPMLLEGSSLLKFDRVIANPPFSLDEWGHDAAARDPHNRFAYGIPPKTRGDWAFVQHMLATLSDRGRLGVVIPHGVLFRGSSEGQIRKAILKDDLLEAVIGLPPNLFYGTGIPAAVLLMSRAKSSERRGKVLFVDASRECREGKNQSSLRDEDIQKIAGVVAEPKDVPRYARLAPIEAIERNELNLNIGRYVAAEEPEQGADVAGALAKLRELEKARSEAEAHMNAHLKQVGYHD
jgi:type I restriction enzyme M protein